jgi:pantetheine-phosphate adenylyltransferase
MITAVYPGTFDPFHNGHLDIAQRALALFDHLIVAVYTAPAKQVLFNHSERIDLAREALASVGYKDRVTVIGYSGLTVQFARQQKAQAIVRGLRNGVDFDFEWQMAQTNHWMASDIEIVCLFANEPNTFVSATLVREVATLGGDVTELVPPCVAKAIVDKCKTNAAQNVKAINNNTANVIQSAERADSHNEPSPAKS